MTKCNIHEFFFDWNCNVCKEEYKELKGTNDVNTPTQIQNKEPPLSNKSISKANNYKDFTEERAKQLYEEVFLQYLQKGNMSEEESIERSKRIIRKQCLIRGIEPWSWV